MFSAWYDWSHFWSWCDCVCSHPPRSTFISSMFQRSGYLECFFLLRILYFLLRSSFSSHLNLVPWLLQAIVNECVCFLPICIFIALFVYLYSYLSLSFCIFVFPPPILLHISFNSGPMAVGRKQKWELSHKLMPKHWTCIYRGKMPKCKMHYFLSTQLFLGHHHLPQNRASQIFSLSSGYLWSRDLRTMQLVFILTLLDAKIHL